jgi:hypothetical protein
MEPEEWTHARDEGILFLRTPPSLEDRDLLNLLWNMFCLDESRPCPCSASSLLHMIHLWLQGDLSSPLCAPHEIAGCRCVTLIMDQHLPCSTQEAKNLTKELWKVITSERGKEVGGKRKCCWLRRYATSRQVAGSRPDEVFESFFKCT